MAGMEFTPRRRLLFCEHLSASGNVRLACASLCVSPQTAYKARRRDAAFALAWDAAMALARDHAEAVLADQALNGVEEPVFYHGEEVARRRRYDSRLLLAHLARLDKRCERPEVEDAAARFDELLAMLGGHAPEPELLEGAPIEEEEGHVPGLATPREAWADWRMHCAYVEEEAAALDEGLAEDDALDLAVEAGAAARDAAVAQWDAHRADACAFVDGTCAGVDTEHAGDGASAPSSCHPRENTEPAPQPSCAPAFAGVTKGAARVMQDKAGATQDRAGGAGNGACVGGKKRTESSLPVFPSGQCQPCHPPLIRVGAPGRMRLVPAGKRAARRRGDCSCDGNHLSRKGERRGPGAIMESEAGVENPPSTKSRPAPVT
jgi:hypothetical protein